MIKTSVIGYPRIGENRELKKSTEKFFKNEVSYQSLLDTAKNLKKKHWETQKEASINFISSNDFSFYDTFLDTAVLLNVIPRRYQELKLKEHETYFAMAKGLQRESKDIKALRMKKWFNTNYHYIVPEINADTKIKLSSDKIFNEYEEAKSLGIETKPVLIGPFSFLKLSKVNINKLPINEIVNAYKNIFQKLNELNVHYLQLDEPYLVRDLNKSDLELFEKVYSELLKNKDGLKILLQTYFGDVRDCYSLIKKMDFWAIGLDFIEGVYNLELLKKEGFNKNQILFAGVVNGKNIWKNNYLKTLNKLTEISQFVEKENIVLNSSCSFLHIPYSLEHETKLDAENKALLAFAKEKLIELKELALLFDKNDFKSNSIFIENQELHEKRAALQSGFSSSDFFDGKEIKRSQNFNERIALQEKVLNLPLLPTTTIGSFPQTADVRSLRRQFKNQEINFSEYKNQIKEKIKSLISYQEDLGLDVLVHGEFERNDMVEYFGENLNGFLFTQNGWVQSYGTRGVKPPIIFSDVSWEKAFTVDWIQYAQSHSKKPVKGMLTGPVTILNWSFPREDITLKESAYQIAVAIQKEVLALEKAGIKVIQIDEAALREKLPLRKADWNKEYLDWAIKAFRISHYNVKSVTQIHSHMCYSDFADIIEAIKNMDADVLSIESSRSDLTMLDTLKEASYENQIGPGVYDIHSPRVPSEEEFYDTILKMIKKLKIEQLWVNPDCGLKTRAWEETSKSLKNMVNATLKARKNL